MPAAATAASAAELRIQRAPERPGPAREPGRPSRRAGLGRRPRPRRDGPRPGATRPARQRPRPGARPLRSRPRGRSGRAIPRPRPWPAGGGGGRGDPGSTAPPSTSQVSGEPLGRRSAPTATIRPSSTSTSARRPSTSPPRMRSTLTGARPGRLRCRRRAVGRGRGRGGPGAGPPRPVTGRLAVCGSATEAATCASAASSSQLPPFGQGRRHRAGRGDAGEGIGHRVGQEARAGVVAPDESHPPPPRRRRRRPGTPSAPSRPWPVIDTQTRGPAASARRASASMPHCRSARGREPSITTSAACRRPRSRATPSADGRSRATDALPWLSRSKNPESSVRPPSGRAGRLHLHHPGPPRSRRWLHSRPGPQRAEVHHEGRRHQRGPGPDPAAGDGVDPGPDLADRGNGQPEEGGALDQVFSRPGAHPLGHGGPRVGRRGGQGQPGGHGVEVLGPGQVDGEPPVGRRQQPGRPAATGRARPGQAGQRGPLAEQGQRVGNRRVGHQGDDRVERPLARGQGRTVGSPGQPGEPTRPPRRGRSRHHPDGSDGVRSGPAFAALG